MRDKSIIYAITLPGRDLPALIGTSEAARRLHLTQAHVRRIVLGERTKTPQFIRNVEVKEIQYHG